MGSETWRLVSFVLILLIGTVTCITDSLYRKIINSHLFFAIILILSSYIGLMVAGETPAQAPLFLLNAIAGFAIGYVLFFSQAWGGGDGKLFFVYSLLVPANPAYARILPLPSFALFVNMFISAFFILMVFAFCSCAASFDHKKVKYDLVLQAIKNFSRCFFNAIVYALAMNWIFVFLMAASGQFNVPPLAMLVVFYLVFMFLNKILVWIKNRSSILFWSILAISIVVQGLMRPGFFFNRFTPGFLLYFVIYLLLQGGADRSRRERKNPFMPFALFMFIGALLSQTNFLNMILTLLRRH